MAVEFGTVHTDELRDAVHRDTAGAAHARTVDHDGIERHIGGHLILLGEQTDKLHHDGGAYGETFVHFLTLQNAFDTLRHQSLTAVGAVVGHDDEFVGRSAHFLFEDDEVLASSGQYRDDTVAGLLECTDNGKQRRHTHSAAGTYHRAETLYMRGLAERPHHIGDAVARLQTAEFVGRDTDFLHNERNGATRRVGLRDGERYAFAMLVYAHDDKMSGLAGTGYQRGLHFQLEDLFGELFLADYLVHIRE